MTDELSVLTQYSPTTPWSSDDGNWRLTRGLAGYLRAVAKAIGVPAEATSFEVSDTATAYLALAQRSPDSPARDLMLVWSERSGWILSVETDPGEAPVVIDRIGGTDPLPEPSVVARFVADALSPGDAERRPLDGFIDMSRPRLVESLTRYMA
nr:DUF6292 family protein [Kibdelosporangium sp. MJ126-NF4]CEL14319.1 hypothetical protein [Kibdelosporangium sp. MJ126-NF4]CTQ88686.1 hypothetical protein [Kibdelosporangium sp. MJ126-NF4]